MISDASSTTRCGRVFREILYLSALFFACGFLYSSLILVVLAKEGPLISASTTSSTQTSPVAAADAARPARPPPNIVIVLTDDLDWTLGGTNASTLSRTRQWIGKGGKIFSNWFVQTPVCCPSRAELLTGKVYHNLRVSSLSAQPNGCMHIDVEAKSSHPFYRRDYFAPFFSESSTIPSNYTVGIFGKHLNNENPKDFLPRGVDEMLVNGGGDYLDPTFTYGRRVYGGTGEDDTMHVHDITFDDCSEFTGMPCYSTSIIGNASLAWIRRQVHQQQQKQQQHDDQHNNTNNNHPQVKPFFALISLKAPHLLDGPEFAMAIPAPWYRNTSIPEQYAPRTPNYNVTGIPPNNHHWLVRTQPPLTKRQAQKVDDLYVSRLKTLISVDDLVDELIRTLDDNHILNNTYIIFTSDNGYRLGQFRMPSCKLHPYENDIRVPMMIRGPGIIPGGISDVLSTHVNLMPTLLGLAKRKLYAQDKSVIPKTMDGTNLAWAVVDYDDDNYDGQDEKDDSLVDKNAVETLQADDNLVEATTSYSITKPNSILIEYMSLGDVVRYQHLVDTYNHTFLALRMILPKQPQQQLYYRIGNEDEDEDYNSDIVPIPFRNWKYIEFRDSRNDWNCSRPPLERELYDLDDDPYEMNNLIPHSGSGIDRHNNNITPSLLKLLHNKMQRMFNCKGPTCRMEATTGLMSDNDGRVVYS